VKLKVFFVLNAVVLGASALTCLLFPDKVLSIYGVEPNPASSFMGLYGALGSIAIVTITWFARNVEDQKAQRAIILALTITYLIGIIISISGIISGVMTKGWPVVGIYLFFALGYAYFLFLKKEGAADAR
jgi:hypothetical protein